MKSKPDRDLYMWNRPGLETVLCFLKTVYSRLIARIISGALEHPRA
jgi:hypothetical protein